MHLIAGLLNNKYKRFKISEILFRNMDLQQEVERPESRGSSIFSDETVRVERPDSRSSSASEEMDDSSSRDGEDEASESEAEHVTNDEFNGPADSTSWWDFEDDSSNGPADSTTSP